ncbi:MAG: Dihydroorotate dehydrogenase (quinone), mitochondrial [Trizodia sp. TS-e1964]|nr:MAG: Dihydroorotate dehydrogenase (quinone), mitochondrial [Trizodia sp. TS-e1964]
MAILPTLHPAAESHAVAGQSLHGGVSLALPQAARHPPPAARRVVSAALSISLDEVASSAVTKPGADDQGPAAAGERRRREPLRRDSMKRREALLKGKEGSRRRQRWENDRLLNNPHAQPPLPCDWEVHPTHPVRHVPYYLAALWDEVSQRANKESSKKSKAKDTPAPAAERVPREIREKLKRARGAKGLLQDLEEEVRCFIAKWEERERTLERERASTPDLDSEDEEIVFIGRNCQMSDMRPPQPRKNELKRDKLVFDSLADDHGASFGRWLVHSIGSYYGLPTWSVTVGDPARRVAYVGIGEVGKLGGCVRTLPQPLLPTAVAKQLFFRQSTRQFTSFRPTHFPHARTTLKHMSLPFPRAPLPVRLRPSTRTITSAPQPNRHSPRRWLTPRSFLRRSAALFLFGSTFYLLTDTLAHFQPWVVVPVVRYLYPDAEDAHTAGISLLQHLYRFKLHPRERGSLDAPLPHPTIFGHQLHNPLGVSAGLDKNGVVIDALFALGPAIVEIGGITPRPQPGNPRPRVWRIPSQQALINRYGLNSAGAAHVAATLRARVQAFALAQGLGTGAEAEQSVLDGHADVPPGSLLPGRLLAVQIAKNKDTPESDLRAVQRDYVDCVAQLGAYADIIVVNVSSPNTPGLRSLQASEPLTRLLTAVVAAAAAIPRRRAPAVMVKVSPDESSAADVRGICTAVWRAGVDGVIVANTTTQRPASPADAAEARALSETGGYSGPQLFGRTLALVQQYRRELDSQGVEAGRKVIFASGGIVSGEEVARVLAAGASVAMAYTAVVYQGVGFFSQTKRQMGALVREGKA